MNLLTREWVDKAEGDFASAQREIRARKSPNYDSAGFHSQQCAEKYFKARLQESGIYFPKTHNLEDLLALLLPIEPLWCALKGSAKILTEFAVMTRYPGSGLDQTQAKDALKRCREIRSLARQSLGLPA
jgi:HEPN domain-containing protein